MTNSNNNTGWQGIEYQVEINGENGIWNRTIQQWSPTGETRILSNTTNLADFKFSNENKNYVILDVDLKKYLISPHRYKVLFYAEERKSDLDIPIFDFSNWITIPPPNFAISISPNPVVVRLGGEDSIATIKINSTTGRESEVHLSPFYNGSKINLSFYQPRLHIPSYGMATSNIHVSSKTNDIGEYPIPIFVNSTFAKEGIDLGKQTNMIQEYYSSHANNFMIPDFIPVENVIEQSTLIVKVDKPFSPNEQFKNWINDWFNPVAAIITPIVSAVSGILGWKIGSSNSKKKQDKTTTEDKDEKKNDAKENSKR